MIKVFLAILFFSQLSQGQIIPEEEIIHHPAAQTEGLQRIDSEGNYIYNTDQKLTNQSLSFHLGMVYNPEVTVEITQHNTQNVYVLDFDTMYDGAQKLSVGLDYEYYFSINSGKLGAQVGGAMQYASGHGRLVSNPSQESIENFTFITMPLFLGLVYRFEYKDRQMIAPYLAGGGTYTALLETRDDQSGVNAIGYFGFYGAAGGLVNVGAFSREFISSMRSEYGISNFWINLEFRIVNVESEAFTYQNNFIQGGVTFDF